MHKQKVTKYEITFAQKWRIWGLKLTTELTIMGDDNERLAEHTQQKLAQVMWTHPYQKVPTLEFRHGAGAYFPSLPFQTVDATTGNQGFGHDRCNIFPGLGYIEENNTFLICSLRKNEVEAHVEFTFKVMESARVTCCSCIS